MKMWNECSSCFDLQNDRLIIINNSLHTFGWINSVDVKMLAQNWPIPMVFVARKKIPSYAARVLCLNSEHQNVKVYLKKTTICEKRTIFFSTLINFQIDVTNFIYNNGKHSLFYPEAIDACIQTFLREKKGEEQNRCLRTSLYTFHPKEMRFYCHGCKTCSLCLFRNIWMFRRLPHRAITLLLLLPLQSKLFFFSWIILAEHTATLIIETSTLKATREIPMASILLRLKNYACELEYRYHMWKWLSNNKRTAKSKQNKSFMSYNIVVAGRMVFFM